MSALTIFFTGLYYLAVSVFFAGTLYRVVRYLRKPSANRRPPKSTTNKNSSATTKKLGEVLLFRSLFRASPSAWIFNWIFHATFVVILLRHAHYFFASPSVWMFHIQNVSSVAAYLMSAALAALWFRRLFVDRLRSLSSHSDHLMLLLLLSIAMSGIALKKIAPENMLAAKNFVRGLMYFDWYPFPPDVLMSVHFALIAILLLVYPFSKLLHAPGFTVKS